ALSYAALVACLSGCPGPGNQQGNSPPVGKPPCRNEYVTDLVASPDTGDLRPDYLVKAGTNVQLTGTIESIKVCDTDLGRADDEVSSEESGVLQKASWQLLYIPREGLPQDVTQSLTPGQTPSENTFLAQSGT